MPVYSFGFPFGQVLATSKGSPAITIGRASVSSLRRDDAGELAFVQIDGALNPGNSGGPVVDTHGRLVGVAVATIKDSTGIGLAIPCKKVPAMLAGRLGKPHLQLVHNADGTPTIQVEVGLVDPFHRIRSAALHYLSADQVQTKPGPADRLKALPGSRQLALKIQEQVAQGQVPVKPGLSRIHILYQGVSVDANGVRRYTASVDETLDLQAAPSAELFVADNPSKEPADGSKPNTNPKPLPSPRPGPNPTSPETVGPRHGTRPATGNPNPSLESPQEVAAVVDALNSGDFSRRVRATMQLLRVMPRQPNPAVAKALERVLLEEGSSPIRVNAALALATWGTQKSIPALQEAAEKDPNSIVRSRRRRRSRPSNCGSEELSMCHRFSSAALLISLAVSVPLSAADLPAPATVTSLDGQWLLATDPQNVGCQQKWTLT